MSFQKTILLFVSCCIISPSCIKSNLNESDNLLPPSSATVLSALGSTMVNTNLIGRLSDEKGIAISDAKVFFGSSSTQSDARGLFVFSGVAINAQYAFVKAEKTGYFMASKTYTPSAHGNTIELTMVKQSDMKTFSASEASIVTNSENVKIVFDANSIVDKNGKAVTGSVNVASNYISPSDADIASVMPGALTGVNASGQVKGLNTYGMLAVNLSDDNGRAVNLKSGTTARIHMPYVAGGPETLPLWYFDETNGVWIQDGQAHKIGNEYVGSVSHFSYWNLDVEYNPYIMFLKVVDEDNHPMPNVEVKITGQRHFDFMSDANGELAIMNSSSTSDMFATLVAKRECDAVEQLFNLGTVTSDVSKILKLKPLSLNTFTLRAKVQNCDKTPIANFGTSLILTDKSTGTSQLISAYTDMNGVFSIYLKLCPNKTYEVEYYYLNQGQLIKGKQEFNTSNAVVNATIDLGISRTCNGGEVVLDIPSDDFIIPFEDLSVFSLIKTSLGITTNDITYGQIKNVKSLGLAISQPNPINLKGLEYFRALESLGISGAFTSMTNFPSLPLLQRLVFYNSQTSDYTFLSKTPNLTYLDLRYNQIRDISALSGLTQLSHLSLSYNQIGDISPLSGLTKLTYLDLGSNLNISNTSALSGLAQLKYLILSADKINNITPLSGLTQLTHLDLSLNQISNIGSLSSLTNLDTLNLAYNQISSINSLSHCLALKTLSLSFNQISSIADLTTLINLDSLNLTKNQLNDITPLSELPNLTGLGLDSNQISNLSPLSGLNKLFNLFLSANQIVDLSPLSNLIGLYGLRLSGNQIVDLSPLSNLSGLYDLQLASNQITDVNALNGLSGLKGLDLSINPGLLPQQIDQLKSQLPNCQIYH